MPRVIRFGGKTQPVARPTDRHPDDRWTPLLEELSWKYVREQAQFEPYVLPPPGGAGLFKVGMTVEEIWFSTQLHDASLTSSIYQTPLLISRPVAVNYGELCRKIRLFGFWVGSV